MSTRWFNVAVVLFWLTTMGWLFSAKILPSLMVGEPPVYGSSEHPVRWELFINGQPLGWASNRAETDEDGVVSHANRVHLEHLPLEDVVPAWLLPTLDAQLAETSMEIRSETEVDPLNRLIGFRSAVDLGALENVVTISGRADGDLLRVTVRSGRLVHKKAIPLPTENIIGGALSPATHLGRLRRGQRWTIPVYSPLRPPTAPVQLLYARVERDEPIIWNGEVVKTHLVVYSSEPDGGNGYEGWQARVWVAEDGRVLKQQIAIVNSFVTFVRLPAEVAVETIQRAAAGSD